MVEANGAALRAGASSPAEVMGTRSDLGYAVGTADGGRIDRRNVTDTAG
jgi:hypothetical protein